MKMLYKELKELFYRYNEMKGVKQYERPILAEVIFTESSFDKPYELESRTYIWHSDNKAYKNCFSSSIYASCKDGKDQNIRMDNYIVDLYGSWEVENCFIKHNKETDEIVESICKELKIKPDYVKE